MNPLGICPAWEVQTAKWLVQWTLDLQSWTTVLGKIFTFGANLHTHQMQDTILLHLPNLALLTPIQC